MRRDTALLTSAWNKGKVRAPAAFPRPASYPPLKKQSGDASGAVLTAQGGPRQAKSFVFSETNHPATGSTLSIVYVRAEPILRTPLTRLSQNVRGGTVYYLVALQTK